MAGLYDVKTDYMKLMQEAAASGDINKAAEYERQRNAKIKGEELPYDLTYDYNPQTDNIAAITSAALANQRNAALANQNTGGEASYTPRQFTPAQSQAAYIKDMYAAQQAQTQQQIENAYRKSVGELDVAERKIAPAYNQARNQTAATSEINRSAFNEYAAASGLSSGAGGQAQLAMSNALLGNMSNLDTQEANAIASLADQRAAMAADYQAAISDAMASNNIALANALYQESARVDSEMFKREQAQAAENRAALNFAYGTRQDEINRALAQEESQRAVTAQEQAQQRAQLEAQAANLAAYGIFDGYKALGYTDEQIAQMKLTWAAANPELAASISPTPSVLGATSYVSGITPSASGTAPLAPTITPPANEPTPSAPVIYNEPILIGFSNVLRHAQVLRQSGQTPDEVANFIVSKIGQGISESEALEIARRLGIA